MVFSRGSIEEPCASVENVWSIVKLLYGESYFEVL